MLTGNRPLLCLLVTDHYCFLTGKRPLLCLLVTDHYCFLTGNGPSNESYCFGPLLRYFLLRGSLCRSIAFVSARAIGRLNNQQPIACAEANVTKLRRKRTSIFLRLISYVVLLLISTRYLSVVSSNLIPFTAFL